MRTFLEKSYFRNKDSYYDECYPSAANNLGDVRKKLDALLNKVKDDSQNNEQKNVVLIYYSGHGIEKNDKLHAVNIDNDQIPL